MLLFGKDSINIFKILKLIKDIVLEKLKNSLREFLKNLSMSKIEKNKMYK